MRNTALNVGFSKLNAAEFLALLFFSSCLVFCRAYSAERAALFCFFGVVALFTIQGRIILRKKLAIFYLTIGCIGVAWSIVGVYYGNSMEGIYANFKLYVFWSVVIFFFYSLLLEFRFFVVVHMAIVISSIMIFMLTALGVAIEYYGLQSFFSPFIVEMNLRVGFHDGYIQVASHNILSVFFLFPYLFAYCFLKGGASQKLDWLALLFISLVLVLSGRRALWLVSGGVIVFILLTRRFLAPGKAFSRSDMVHFAVTLLVLFASCIGLWFWIMDSSTASHLLSAFSGEDERARQAPYLIDAFMEKPWFGGGFGASVEYLRSANNPWLYEMTYLQLVFNVGTVGVLLFGVLLLVYFFCAVVNLKSDKYSASYTGALLGLICLAVGAYSNPYLSSFDSLMIVGLLPALSCAGQARAGL